MQLFDEQGRRLYFTDEERRAFLRAAVTAPRETRSFCSTLHYTGCRISEALSVSPKPVDLSGKVIIFETLKKRRRGVFRAVPVPADLGLEACIQGTSFLRPNQVPVDVLMKEVREKELLKAAR